MTDRELKSIEVEGYASIRSARVGLGRLNVLIGANGAGKSNFIRVFELLGRLVEEDLGFFVGVNGRRFGAAQLDRGPPSHRTRRGFRPLRAVLVPASGDELVFERESSNPQDDRVEMPPGRRETQLPFVAQALASVSRPADLMRGCRVYHFHDTSRHAPVKRMVPTADNLVLRNDAGNLAAVLLVLSDSDDPSHQASHRRIVGVVRQVAPFFQDFVLRPEKGDRSRLRWRQQTPMPCSRPTRCRTAPFASSASRRSCCTRNCLRWWCWTSRNWACTPTRRPVGGLAAAGIRAQPGSHRHPVGHFDEPVQLDDLIVVERVDGASTFTRPDRERLGAWLEEYSLGELWEKNLIGGRPGGHP